MGPFMCDAAARWGGFSSSRKFTGAKVGVAYWQKAKLNKGCLKPEKNISSRCCGMRFIAFEKASTFFEL